MIIIIYYRRLKRKIIVKRFMCKVMNNDGKETLIRRQLVSVSYLGTPLPRYIVINHVIFEVEPFIYQLYKCYNYLLYEYVQQSC